MGHFDHFAEHLSRLAEKNNDEKQGTEGQGDLLKKPLEPYNPVTIVRDEGPEPKTPASTGPVKGTHIPKK